MAASLAIDVCGFQEWLSLKSTFVQLNGAEERDLFTTFAPMASPAFPECSTEGPERRLTTPTAKSGQRPFW